MRSLAALCARNEESATTANSLSQAANVRTSPIVRFLRPKRKKPASGDTRYQVQREH